MRSLISTSLLLAATATSSAAQISSFSEDFESLVQSDPSALADAGWLVFGNVYDPSGGYLYGYGPNPAPNGGPGFCGIDLGQGGPAQGLQQHVVYSDYGNGDHANGNFIEANVFQEQIVGAGDVGKTLVFRFDAKLGNLASPATAQAFIKIIDGTTFALDGYEFLDTTNLPATWGTYSVSITIDASHVGDFFQFGYSSYATGFTPTGVFYDNLELSESSAPLPDASGFSDSAGWELPQVPPAAPGAPACGTTESTYQGPALSSSLDRRSTVLLHSGEFHWSETDLQLPGINDGGLRWVRRYRSRLGRSTAMGEGWDHSFNVYVEPEQGSLATGMGLWDGNGYLHRMRPTEGDPSVLSEPGFSATLQQEQDGRWTVLFANGGRWILLPLDGSPAEGKLERIVDRNGNEVLLSYDGAGRLESILDTMGNVTLVAYDAQGRISSVTGPSDREYTYSYYAAGDPLGSEGDLASVTSPAVVGTINGNNFPQGKTTTYTYSTGQASEDLNHNLLTITNAAGETWLTNVYGAGSGPMQRDRVLRQFLGKQTTVTDYRYARIPASRALAGEVVTAVVNDRMGNVCHHSFDQRNRLVREERFTGRARPRRPSGLEFNRPTGKLRASDPDSYVTLHSWNADDRCVLTVQPSGSSVLRVHEFDLNPLAAPRARGNLRELRRLAGPLGGDQAELVTQYEYAPGHSGCCGVDFVARYTDPAGKVTLHEYDPNGNRTRTTHPGQGIVEDWEYDPRGRVVAHYHAETPPQVRRVDLFEYYPDQGGPESGQLHRSIVDGLNLGLTTQFAYDFFGHQSIVVDPGGGQRQTIFNQLGQPILSRSPEATPGAGDWRIVVYFYDEADRLVTQIELWEGIDLGASRSVQSYFDYDSLGRLRRQSTKVGGTPTTLSDRRYAYDRNGQLAAERTVLADGSSAQEVEFEHDERGLLWRRLDAPQSNQETVSESRYDGNGRLSGHTTTSGGTVWEDLVVTNDGFGRPVLTLDALVGTEASIAYDPRGLRVSQQVRGQLAVDGDLSDIVPLSTASWTHDDLGRPLETTVQHFGTSTGNAIGDGTSKSRNLWVGVGQLRSFKDDQGGVTSFEYDSAQRLIQITDQKGDRTEFLLDTRGNRVVTTRTSQPDLSGQPEVRTYFASFDGRSRRISLSDPLQGTHSWVYDSRGQVTSAVDPRGNRKLFIHDGLGRDVQTEEILTDSGDGAGSEVARIVTSRTYDTAGRLLTSTDPNGNVTAFGYDALGNMSSRTLADGSSSTWTYQGPALVQSVDANGTVIVSQYVDGRLAARNVAQAGPGVVASDEQFTWDGLGRLVAASDDDSLVTFARDSMGNIVEESLTIGIGPGAVTGTTSRVHDGMGGMTELTYPGGRSLSYQLRHVGEQAQILGISEGAQELASFAYLGDRVEQRQLSLGAQGEPLRSAYSYDPRGWLDSEQHSFGLQSIPVVKLAHQHDSVGNLSSYDDLLLQRFHSMEYDSADRLVRSAHDRANGVDEVQDYTLDLAGNRLQVVGGPDAGTYFMESTDPPADAQVNQYTQTPWEGRVYSETGNLVTRIPNAGAPVMNTFDHAGRAVVLEGSFRALRYDVLGRLIQEVVNSDSGPATYSYFYLGDLLIEERVGDQQPQVRTWVRAGAGAPISMRAGASGDTALLSSPGLGVLAAVDSSGQTLERYDYGDYGRVMDALTGAPLESSAAGNRFFFRGLQQDLAAGDILIGSQRIETSTGRRVNRAGALPDASRPSQSGFMKLGDIKGEFMGAHPVPTAGSGGGSTSHWTSPPLLGGISIGNALHSKGSLSRPRLGGIRVGNPADNFRGSLSRPRLGGIRVGNPADRVAARSGLTVPLLGGIVVRSPGDTFTASNGDVEANRVRTNVSLGMDCDDSFSMTDPDNTEYCQVMCRQIQSLLSKVSIWDMLTGTGYAALVQQAQKKYAEAGCVNIKGTGGGSSGGASVGGFDIGIVLTSD